MSSYNLTYVRSTKNKHVYQDADDLFGSVYVPKSEVSDPPPENLEMIIQPYQDD